MVCTGTKNCYLVQSDPNRLQGFAVVAGMGGEGIMNVE
jgi:hypothetical protein